MPKTSEPILPAKEYSLAEQKLGDMATTIEFTMISIIAGLMLIPLIDAAAPLIYGLRVEYWIYIVVQLAAIMFFWTALISHALTFVRWPIDIGHNLLYLILFSLVGIEMHYISEPRAFYPMFTATAVVSAVLVAYDLSLVRRLRKGAQGAAAELYDAAYSRQLMLLYLTPGGLLITLIMSGLILAFPDVFVGQHMHVVLGFGVLAYTVFLLTREIRQLSGLRGKILSMTAEQMAKGQNKTSD